MNWAEYLKYDGERRLLGLWQEKAIREGYDIESLDILGMLNMMLRKPSNRETLYPRPLSDDTLQILEITDRFEERSRRVNLSVGGPNCPCREMYRAMHR